MKMLSTVSYRPRLITAAIFGALALSLGAVSNAATGSIVGQTIVKFGDLDVSNPLDAATLYHRIETAADQVCQTYDPNDERDTLDEMLLHVCVDKAIADAVTKVHQPELFAIYEADSDRRP